MSRNDHPYAPNTANIVSSSLSSSLKTLQLGLFISSLDEDDSSNNRISSELMTNDICERLFQGMAIDEPPGIADLEHVSLTSRCNWNKSSAEALRCTLSSSASRLVKLQLHCFGRMDESMTLLASGLVSNHCSLVELDLSGCVIGDNDGAEQLARALWCIERDSNNNNGSTVNTLRELKLTCTQIGNRCAIAIATALSHPFHLRHQSLTALFLGSNHIGDDGVVALVKAVTTHPTLAHWSIDRNPIKQKGCRALLESIPHLQSIKTLEIGPFSAEAIGDIVTIGNQQQEPHHNCNGVDTIQQIAAGSVHNHVLNDVHLVRLGSTHGVFDMWDLSRHLLPPSIFPNVLLDMWDQPPQHQHHQPSNVANNMMTLRRPMHPPSRIGGPIAALPIAIRNLVLESLAVYNFFISLNRLQLRHIVLSHDVTPGLWPIILERLNRVPSLVFYMLRESNPHVLNLHGGGGGGGGSGSCDGGNLGDDDDD